MSSIIEAKLVLSGEDRATAAVDNVVKALKQIEDASKVSASVDKLARSLLETEKAQKAVTAAMNARNGLQQAQATLKAASAEAARLAGEYDKARAAAAAFNGVRLTKGSEQARTAAAARTAVRELGKEYRTAERSVRVATAAVAAQTATLQHAERAATALGADLSNLAGRQRQLKAATESTTQALRQQISAEERAAQAAAHHRREMQEYARHMRRHGALGTAAAAASGYVGAHTVAHGVSETVRAGARYQHEVVALKNAGRTAHEMEEIEAASRATTRAVPTATFEENLKVINETTGAFGDLHHAIENLTFMQKSASVLHASAGDKIHEGAGELGNKLARFFEMRGTAGNTPVFQREAGELIRAMAFTRGNFNPREAVNFAQQAKASLPLYSERFLTKIAPSLVTEYGGDRAGTAANAFRNVILGKANDKKQAEAWLNLGLLDPKKTITKGGHAVSWSGGAVKNTNLALSDPLEWAQTVLLPALRKKGVNVDDKLELTKALGTMFRNSNSNLFAEALTQKLSVQRLLKDEVNINKAGTLDQIYARNLSEDPTQAFKAVTASLENLITTASSPLMAQASVGLKSVAEGVQSLALVAKDHPNLAVAGGIGVAGAGFGAAGYLSYKLATGFGLSGSATALTHSAAMLDAAAVRLGAGGAAGVAGTAAPAAAGVGLAGGVAAAGVAAGAAVAGVATAEQLPKVLKEKGPTAIDPATGGVIDQNPMGEFGPAIKEWWKSHAPTWFGGEPAKEAGRAAGQGIADGVKEKASEVQSQGQTIYDRMKALFAQGINMPINLAPGEGFGGGGSLIQRASFGGGTAGGAAGALASISSAAPGGKGGGAVGSGSGRYASLPSGRGGGRDRYTGAPNWLAAGARESYDFWIGKGATPAQAAGLVGMEQGENNFKPHGYGDRGTSYGSFMWKMDRRREILAGTGINVHGATHQQQLEAAYWEMTQGRHKGFWGRLRQTTTPEEAAALGVRRFEIPADIPGASRRRGGFGRDWYNRFQREDDERAKTMQRALPPKPAQDDASASLQNVAATLRDMSLRTHHLVEVSASPGLQARTRGMRATTSGPIKADVGVSMPQARSEGDWI
ncbi:phage tail tip lysozyme [Methylobacterium nodulans]|uniref:Phage tail lysozyme domain-containing protein n=1 Tax=Methylobacterium nodulans (strain LMG 21967 / CNCM I-2342 / ORS 2060) TaxID=460265 RepID=B8ICL0_METNO|nr:phage tail tip lysozyme [Methylobacterium nodulans]ACL57421.1 hypothetical protein Mnod_2451 [Methylobacterium nodulans ORS 2060]